MVSPPPAMANAAQSASASNNDGQPYDLLIRQAQLWQGEEASSPGEKTPLAQPRSPESDWVDIGIRAGRIVAIAPQLSGPAQQTIDAKGNLVSPPFVESHIHLDSALTAGDPRWNQSGTLFEGIEIWGDRKQSLTATDVKARALAALQLQASQGVLHVRSHVDVSEPQLIALQALLEVRDQVKGWMDLQLVAFPQDGLYGSPPNEALLEEALKLGADVVGGIPHYELTREDGVRSVHRLFDLAEQYDRPLDFHCDEIDDPQSRFLETVAACALRRGLGQRVTASHTTAFGSYDNGYALKLMGLLRRAQLNFVANPLINLTLQGRGDSYPKRRGLTRVKELWQAGLNVSLGHDCIRDPWYSLGSGSALDVAHMAVHACHMTGQAELAACLAMVTYNGAKTLGLSTYGLQVQQPANLLLLPNDSPRSAILHRHPPEWVIALGKPLSHCPAPQPQWFGTSDRPTP